MHDDGAEPPDLEFFQAYLRAAVKREWTCANIWAVWQVNNPRGQVSWEILKREVWALLPALGTPAMWQHYLDATDPPNP